MRQIPFANPSERIIGFTIPKDGRFHLCDHDQVWEVAIEPPLIIELTDRQPYPFVDASHDFIGLWVTGDDPILRIGTNEISYRFDPRSPQVELRYRIGGGRAASNFRPFRATGSARPSRATAAISSSPSRIVSICTK